MKIREIPLEKVGLMTVADAAAKLGRTEKAVQNYVNDGLLPVILVGRAYLLRMSDVKRFELPARGRPRKPS